MATEDNLIDPITGASASTTEIQRAEHDGTANTSVKKVGLYGWNQNDMEWFRLAASGDGVLIAGDTFPIGEYDKIDLGYSGTQVSTVTYKLGLVTVATLTLNYTGTVLNSVVRT